MISTARRHLAFFLPRKEIRAFDSGFEFFILVLATFGVAVSTICAVLHIGPWSNHGAEWLLFLGGALFLNTTHNAFTYHALLFFPESRQWMYGTKSFSKWILWTKWLLIFFLIVVFFRFIILTTGSPDALGIAPWIAAFIKFFPFHHGIKQISGISLIYNQKIKMRFSANDPVLRQFEICEKREKLFFLLLLLSLGSTLVTSIALLDGSLLNRILPWVGSFLVGAILWNSTRYPAVEKSNKTYFLTRLLFYPISQYTFFASFFIGATHGTEYLGIYQKMYQNSKIRGMRSLAYLTLLTALIVFLFLGNPYQGLHWFLAPRWPSYINALNWMAVFTLSFTFMHYYLDRCIFKMRDPMVRASIGPLLINDDKLAPSAPLTPSYRVSI